MKKSELKKWHREALADDAYESLQLAEKFRAFLSENQDCLVEIDYNNSIRIFRVYSEEFQNYLMFKFELTDMKIIKQIVKRVALNALQDLFTERTKVFHRVAYDEENAFIGVDLGDGRNFIEISSSGVQVTYQSVFKFLSSFGQDKIPQPYELPLREFIDDFHDVFPFGKEGNLLALAFIVNCFFRGHGENPILVVNGPYGSGKTSACNFLKMLVNPTTPMSILAPETVKDLVAHANSTYLPLFDNCSELRKELVDAFCVMSSGSGHSSRKLYFQGTEAKFILHQPCIVNGLVNPSTRPDFCDRAIYLTTKYLADKDRMSKSALEKRFRSYYPGLLNGVYDICEICLKLLPEIRHKNLPRLSDFARICLAIEKIPELKADGLLDIYLENAKAKEMDQFTNNQLCLLIKTALSELEKTKTELSGTTLQVIEKLKRFKKSNESIPELGHPRTFNDFLREHETLFNKNGITVYLGKKTSKGVRVEIRYHKSDESDDNDYSFL